MALRTFSQMSGQRIERKLAAILAADVAGYSRLMGEDEEGTLAALKAIRRELTDPKIKEHHGRIVKTMGDGLLVEFPSVVDAVRCAVETQREMAVRNAEVPPERLIQFRMGINLGDIIKDGRDIHGDGVNVAARLEALAEPGGICLSRVVRDQIRDKLDFAFEDMGEQQVKNIARAVRVFRIQVGEHPVKPSFDQRAPLPLPDKPSLAVLPFQNMSGDPEQEYFADGIVEEITTAISRLPWLFVIARNSSFTYKGKSVDVRQVARELGVRYVLEGSVRKAGNRVRITGQLIDTSSGAHIWADRFDGALDDIFELQDQVAGGVVGAIEPKLRAAEIERATRKPTESLDAYDLYLRALAEFNKLTGEGMSAAIALLERALAIDSTYLPAVALTGFCRVLQRTHGWIAPAGPEAAAGLRLARQAVEAGKDDSDVLWMASYTLAALARENAAAMRGIDRALVLNPNSAHAWMAKGLVSCFSNLPDAAVEAFMRAMRLSPLDPLSYVFRFGLAFANFLMRRYEEALEWAEQSAREQPRYVPPLRLKVVICALLDRLEDAQSSLRQLLELSPGLTMANFDASVPGISPEYREVCAEGLRKAGLLER